MEECMLFRVRVLAWLSIGLILAPVGLISQEPGETFCILHDFGTPKTQDGDMTLQSAGVIALADDGSLWTTVRQGGAYGVGLVIKVTTNGQYTKIADFNRAINGGDSQG